MKDLKAPKQDKTDFQGQTRVELAAEIRCLAYKLYEQRGRADGHALEDWARAEAEVLHSQRTAATT
jgi:hypothetical protein